MIDSNNYLSRSRSWIDVIHVVFVTKVNDSYLSRSRSWIGDVIHGVFVTKVNDSCFILCDFIEGH